MGRADWLASYGMLHVSMLLKRACSETICISIRSKIPQTIFMTRANIYLLLLQFMGPVGYEVFTVMYNTRRNTKQDSHL